MTELRRDLGFAAVDQRLDLDLTIDQELKHPELLNSISYFSLLKLIRETSAVREMKP
mgnify:CR=1 FL=1